MGKKRAGTAGLLVPSSWDALKILEYPLTVC